MEEFIDNLAHQLCEMSRKSDSAEYHAVIDHLLDELYNLADDGQCELLTASDAIARLKGGLREITSAANALDGWLDEQAAAH